jgi:hypothetical protein
MRRAASLGSLSPLGPNTGHRPQHREIQPIRSTRLAEVRRNRTPRNDHRRTGCRSPLSSIATSSMPANGLPVTANSR